MTAIAVDLDKEKLRDFCHRWKITEFALFGSAVRPDEFRADSDVDVLVSFAAEAEWSLFDHRTGGRLSVRASMTAKFGDGV